MKSVYTIYNGATPKMSGKKKVVLLGCIGLGILLLILCFTDRTLERSCVVVENGVETNGTITVTYKQGPGAVAGVLFGKVTVRAGDRELDYRFMDNGSRLYDLVDCKSAGVFGFSQHAEGFGDLYFDNEMESVALISPERQIYAADDGLMKVLESRGMGMRDDLLQPIFNKTPVKETDPA